MKTLLLVLLTLVSVSNALADCSSSGLYAYPLTEKIPQNSLIILEGYARSQSVIHLLGSDYQVYLESKYHRVRMKVKEIHEGSFDLTQAILSPETPLKLGQKYVLRIEGLEELQNKPLTRWDSKRNEHVPVSWTIEQSSDSKAPEWMNAPALLSKGAAYFGCGPAVNAIFSVDAKDESAILAQIELVEVSSGESTTYYLFISENKEVSVGHNMCSGAFNYKEKGKYKVRFQLSDICGNSQNTWSEWIVFDSPFMDTK